MKTTGGKAHLLLGVGARLFPNPLPFTGTESTKMTDDNPRNPTMAAKALKKKKKKSKPLR